MRTPQEKRAGLELAFMSLIWGYGFIAIVHAFQSFSPIAIAGYRFVLCFLIMLPILLGVRSMRREFTWKSAKAALIPGIFLGLTLFLQTLGLKFTTATKSGFITTLYILFVPILERVWLGRRLTPLHYIYVALGLVGTAMICKFTAGEFNIGDLMTLACAITCTVQIVGISRFANDVKSPFVLNGFQCLWAGMICMSALAFFGGWEIHDLTPKSLGSFLYLAIFSSVIAFTIQVRAQKILSASTSSMITLLESPAATFFAFMLLGESLDLSQWVGAVLILLAAVLVVREPTPSSTDSNKTK